MLKSWFSGLLLHSTHLVLSLGYIVISYIRELNAQLRLSLSVTLFDRHYGDGRQ